MPKSKTEVFFRVIKAKPGHPCAGLYAVEKLWFKEGKPIKRDIVHTWDLRIISEAILAKLGGGDAYEGYKIDNDLEDVVTEPHTTDVTARNPEDLRDLTPRKLANELKLKEPK